MIKIITPAKRPELTQTPNDWRNSSQTPALTSKCNGMPQDSCASDADIAAIDSMMNGSDATVKSEQPADKIVVDRGLGLRAPIAITPEKAAELMVANYCRQNGGVIVDSKKPNQIILG